MKRAARRRMTLWIAIAHVLVSAGAGAAAVALSGGSGGGSGQGLSLSVTAAKPPPVVDGVPRVDVGSAHSPRLSHQLSGGPVNPGRALPASASGRGVDIASYQHPGGAVINWRQVAAAGYTFASVKASEGTYYANPYYATDLAQAKAAGLYVTGYHFAVPNISTGAVQADYAVKHARYAPDGRTLPLELDIEYDPYGPVCYGLSAARMVAWISSFAAEARRLTGQPTIIYTTADWWRACTGNSGAFGPDPLWVAAYRPGSPPVPPPGWRNWTFWQYTSRARVPGITTPVDVSYFSATVVRLLDPGSQHSVAGTAVRVPVRSLNAADGRPVVFTAAGLPPGLSISAAGLITGTIAAQAPAVHTVTVTALTPSGGTGAVTFTWAVTAR